MTHLNLPQLLEVEQLASHLHHPNLKIIDLSKNAVYQNIHLPKAIHVQPKALVEQHEDALGKLPNPAKLQQLIDDLGLTPEHWVVAYDDEGGAWASRFLWTLHCIGFFNTSLLNGGIQAWRKAQLPTTQMIVKPTTSKPTVRVNIDNQKKYNLTYDEIKKHIANQTIQIWDCRGYEEYTGIKRTARYAGHIKSAIHADIQKILDYENQLKLQSLSHIQHVLMQFDFDFTKPVVVYCHAHHRSALAYMIGRLLNWEIYAYDGGWSEWGNNPYSPIVTGEKPL